MGGIIERIWLRFRVPIVIALFALAVPTLAMWYRTGSVRHGLLACALALYATSFLSPGIMQAVCEKRLLTFEAGPRNALLLGTALGVISAIMAFTGL